MIAVSENVKLREEEVSYRAVRASGPGGQHVNTTSSAIQLRFNAKKSPAITQAMFNRLRLVAGRRLNTEGVLTLRAEAHRQPTPQQRRRNAASYPTSEVSRKTAKAPEDNTPYKSLKGTPFIKQSSS